MSYDQYAGQIDDVRVYDYVLDAAEVQQLYVDMIPDIYLPRIPSPADDAEHVSVDTDLGWTPGIDIDTQEVYFDAGLGAPTTLVASGDDTLATVANSLLNGGSPLAMNTDYSWQVVSYIGATPYPGPVWTFKTAVGLAYHWPLDGNLNEVISGNNGDPNGPITYVEGADGVAGNAISVTTETFVTSTNNIGITANTPRTLICWFKAPSTDIMMSPVTTGGIAGVGNLFEILLLDTGYAEGHFNGGGYATGATIPYSANTWYMAAVVYDGTTASYYQNAAFSSSSAALSLNTTDSPAEIGGSVWTTTEYAGEIDDVRIYDVALSPSEVAQLYVDMVGGYTCSNPPAMDFTGDCVLDVTDMLDFLSEWLKCGRYPQSTCP